MATVLEQRPAGLRQRLGYTRVERSTVLLALTSALLLLGVVLAVFGMRYRTNDDATLANIAAGAYGADRIHLIYVNIVFGCLIRPLYFLAEGANWYVLVQLALTVLSCAVLCGLAIQKLGKAKGLCLFWALAVPFSTHVLYNFQYVHNAGLCLAAGLALVICTLGRPDRWTALGIFLVWMGSLLRWQMFVAVGGLSAALLLCRFLQLEKPGKKRAVLTMALLFALVLGAKGIDLLAYRLDEGWAAYTAYNAARTDFNDYKAQLLPPENILSQLGISDNDYAMLLGWDFYDGTVFPVHRVQQLADAVPPLGIWQAAKNTVKAFLRMLNGTTAQYALLAVFLSGLILLKFGRGLLPFWGTVIMYGIEVFYLQLNARFPSYVEIPLLLAGCVFGLLAIEDCPLRLKPRLPLILVTLVLSVYICFPSLKANWNASRSYREWAVQEQHYFEAMSQDKEHLYLLSTESINVGAGLDVWRPRGKDFYSNILAYGGWLSHAPHRQQVLANYGLQDPLTGAVDHPAVYLDYHNIQRSADYAAQHLGVAVTAVKTGENDFAPYQLQTAKEE